jgi:hypothetical protein
MVRREPRRVVDATIGGGHDGQEACATELSHVDCVGVFGTTDCGPVRDGVRYCE